MPSPDAAAVAAAALVGVFWRRQAAAGAGRAARMLRSGLHRGEVRR